VYNVWKASSGSGRYLGGSVSCFLLEADSLRRGGVAASCMTLSEYITRSTSPLFDLACTSGLLVVPTSHLVINAYPTPGRLQEAPNRSTFMNLLHSPLGLSYRWTRRDHNWCCPDMFFTTSCRTYIDDTATQSHDHADNHRAPRNPRCTLYFFTKDFSHIPPLH
jgi:hypothetical protein